MFRSTIKRGAFLASSRRFASSYASPASNSWRRPAVIATGAIVGFAGYSVLASSIVHADEPAKEEKTPGATISSITEEEVITPEVSILEEQIEVTTSDAVAAVEGKAEEAEEESQGAYNPETGEINWDCPCLGGMADGPCGEEFKAAFSCFVYSEAEPKGADCIEKFAAMQNCFRQHPEVYAEELREEEPLEVQQKEPVKVKEETTSFPEPAHPEMAEIPAEDGVESHVSEDK